MRVELVDPLFDPFYEYPWEIIYDDAGRPIGEVFLLKVPAPPKRRKVRWKKK